MSRSYKKNPWVTDHKCNSTKVNKRIANRIFRRKLKNCDVLPTLTHHKKITESWDICDYRWRMTKQEAIDWYNEQLEWHKNHNSLSYFLERYPTLESWLKEWEKSFRRK